MPTAPLSPATAIFGPDAAAAAPGASAAAVTTAPSVQQHVQHGKGPPVAHPAQLLGKGRAPEQELTAAAHAAEGLALQEAAASEPPSAAASAASQGHEGGSEAAAPGVAAPQVEKCTPPLACNASMGAFLHFTVLRASIDDMLIQEM